MPKSTSPPPDAYPLSEEGLFSGTEPGSDPDISVTVEIDEFEDAQYDDDDGARSTRIDDQVQSRVQASLLIPSERPPRASDSIPPNADGRPLKARASSYAGRYELVGLLGVGGMGSVYRVKDTVLDEEVALKILRKDLGDSKPAVARFRDEVKVTRRITDRNVVRIYDIGERRGEHFYTMECILGEPLSAFISNDQPSGLDLALDFALQIACGLRAAHACGIVHRDLKPDNLMVARDGRLVITDFGVAVSRDDPAVDVLPMRGAGTPKYMAPEQIEGRNISERTDLYALGLIVYELLTGRLPWPSGPDADSNLARLSVPATSPRTINPEVPEDIAQLVVNLLEREPGERPGSAGEVIEAFEAIRSRRCQPATGPAHPPPPRKESRREWPAIATTNSPHSRSVGVLPFRNLGDARDGYIVEALTAALVDKLVVCPTVRVAKRFALESEQHSDVCLLGRQAGVDVVIEGTLTKRATGMMAVTARVVEVERGFVLWAKRFQRLASDLFELQSEIVASLTEVLALDYSDLRPDNAPANRENVDGFLRATQAHAEWTPSGCSTAIGLLEEGLQRSPDDPSLQSLLAAAKLREWYITPRSSGSLAADANSHARAAAETNPNLGEAHLALGMHAFYNANWAAAARKLEEAVRCNPALSDAHRALGYLHCAADRLDQGVSMLDLALRIDPRNLAALWDSAYVAAFLKQARRAAEFLDKADQVFSNHPETLLARVRIGLWLGDRLMLAWARENAESFELEGPSLQSIAIKLFLEQEPDAEVGSLTAIAAHPDTPPAGRARLMQLVAERMAFGGQIDEAWSALRAASAHTIDAVWYNRCPALSRMVRVPAYVSLRSHVAARAAQLFETSAPAPSQR